MSQHNIDRSDTAASTPAAIELRALIRARIRSGRLPDMRGHRLFGGKGDGTLCACCDRFITGAEIQFDIESPQPQGWASHAMHLGCFELWRSESEAIGPRRALKAEELSTTLSI